MRFPVSVGYNKSVFLNTVLYNVISYLKQVYQLETLIHFIYCPHVKKKQLVLLSLVDAVLALDAAIFESLIR